MDRVTAGGGVLAYVHSSIPVTRLVTAEVSNKEVLWLLLKPPRTPRPYSSIIVGVVYHPPGQSTENNNDMTEYLTTCLDGFLTNRPSSGIVIAGDFNKLNLSRLCNRFDLKKHVTAPTRGNNILDQYCTNMHNLFNPVQHLPPIGRSDHQCLLLTPAVMQKTPAISKRIRLLTTSNRNALSLRIIQENWTPVYEAQDIDKKVGNFNSIWTKIVHETIPEKTVRVHQSDKPWMTSYIKAKIKQRQRAYAKGDSVRYSQLCDTVRGLISHAKARYYNSKAKDLRSSNPAKWYKTINALIGANDTNTRVRIPEIEIQETAKKLQSAFTKPWANLRNENKVDVGEVNHLLKDTPPRQPSIGQVKSHLNHLNPRKATGVDNIPAWILKHFSEDLAPVIHDIIICSISQCRYPTLYKHALIAPVPKVTNPCDIENDFRQISILPQMAKIIEKIQLQLNGPDLKVKNNQHAFTQGRSTVSALISITQKWYDATDNSLSGRKGVHAVFLDFRKAFDSVNHNILLEKLAYMRINKFFLLWIRSFLSSRTQQVNLNGTLSSIANCPCGVPQGSVLSPALFNIHINDLENSIPDDLEIDTTKYADDCTEDQLVEQGKSSSMQIAIDYVCKWAETNKMELNKKKTKDMWICFTDSAQEPPPTQIGDDIIERVKTFKLLGVWCQDDLKWNEHIEQITRKANRRLFHLRQSMKSHLPTEVGLTTYTSKIRPILEYASPVWCGLPGYLQNEVEKVQRRSLRILGLDSDFLPTLDTRRNKASSREFERICKDPEHPCQKLLPDKIMNPYELRRNPREYQISSSTERHKNSFIPRCCK